MKRKAFFIESKHEVFDYATCDKCGLKIHEVFDYATCDKCGLKIKDVQDGKCFWNPNKNARDRNICRNCYDVFRHEREEGWRLWQEKKATLEIENNFHDITKPRTKEQIKTIRIPTVEIEKDLLEAEIELQKNLELINSLKEHSKNIKYFHQRLEEILEFRKQMEVRCQ